MSNGESVKPPFEDAVAAPRLISGAGRMIWCPSIAGPQLYYRAQQDLPATLEEFRNQGERAMLEQRWRIALLKVNKIPASGHPSDYKFLHYLRLPVKSEHGSYVRQSDIFSYNRMMELMTGLYNPSTPDPMARFPNHISDEIRVWNRMKHLAEIRAREEWSASHK